MVKVNKIIIIYKNYIRWRIQIIIKLGFLTQKSFQKNKKHLKIKGEGDKNYIKDNIRNCMCIKKSTYLYLYCLNKNIKMSSNFATRPLGYVLESWLH